MLRRKMSALLCLLLCVGVWPQTTIQAQTTTVTINIDVNANRRPINPLIYGVAYANAATLADLNSPLNRSGGNTATRYNWQLNASNHANDWYYQSISDGNAVPGESGDNFIFDSKAGGAEAMLTIPTIGWAANLGAGRSKLASFSIARYGAQTGNDWQWFPDAGNGIRTNGQFVTGNNPSDANVATDSIFQQDWVRHLTGKWGTAAGAGLRYYILDNEPSIWHSTHRDVHPTGATMEEIRDKIFDYAAKIKAVDSAAIVVGPEEWGWSGYIYSGYDQQYGSQHGWSSFPDRAAHGGADYLPWLLGQLRQRDAATGQRLLNVFSVHYYPQGGEFSNDTSSAMQLRRNRSTRSLWDPSYTDETWINDRVQLIPRLRGWIAANYPGTKTAVTEYNWGAEGHINGATTQADILGIFGREGLDMAARWTTPDASTPTYKAIKMYRNYDGNKSAFGETSVAATVPNPDNISAFAAERATDGALTLMVINKQLSGAINATVNLSNFNGAGQAQVWQLTSANSITHLSNINFTGNSLQLNAPQQSVTLLVIPKATVTPPTLTLGGRVTLGNGNLAGVTVSLGGAGTATTMTDASGLYAFPNLAAGNYTVTLSRDNFSFAPMSRALTLSNANITNADFAASSTAANPQPAGGSILISEFRLSGMTSDDEFIELYNNTAAPLNLGGYHLDVLSGPSINIPSNTTIPSRGHYLLAHSTAYTLASYATADQTYAFDLPSDTGLALFNPAGAIVDAVGFNAIPAPYLEGNGLNAINNTGQQYAFVRIFPTGQPQDTGDNAADFALIATDGNATLPAAQLGAPGPENRFSPLINNNVAISLVDPLASRSSGPNLVRTGSGNSGTLVIRRHFTNNTGGTLTRLRFRIIDITTLGTPALNPPQSDLRLTDSTDQTISTNLGMVTIKGTQLEQTPVPSMGGGLNTTMSIALPTGGLANGESLDAQFLMNVVLNGRFRFFLNVEALP